MPKAKARLLKSAAISEFVDTANFINDIAQTLDKSASENLEGVLDDVDVIRMRLEDFRRIYKALLSA